MDSINYLQRQVVYRKNPPPGLPHPRAFLSAGCPTDLACQPRNSAPPTSLHFVRTYTHLFPRFFCKLYTNQVKQLYGKQLRVYSCPAKLYTNYTPPAVLASQSPDIHRQAEAEPMEGRLSACAGRDERPRAGRVSGKVSQPKSGKVTMYSWCIVETTNYTPAIH